MLNRALPDNFDSDIGTAFAAFRELTFRKEALMLTTSRNWYVVVLTGGLLLSGCNRGGNESQKTLGEKFDSATESAEQTADRVGEKAKAGAEVARDKLEATADKLEHKMEHAADRMEARSDQAGNALDDAGITGKVKTALIAATSLAAFKIDVAVGGPLSYPRAQAKRAQRDSADIRKTTFMTGTLEDHMAQLDLLKLGSNVAVPPVYMAILSAADPSIAPPGQDVLYLNSTVPAVPSGGWDARKAEYSATIRRSAKRFLSGLNAELGGVESSPADFESRFGTPRGCYFHVDMIPTRMGANRPAPGLGGYTTPVEALFISGAGTHPGGGVSGWPGRLAAQRALKG